MLTHASPVQTEIASKPQEVVEHAAHLPVDALLQASRRLDWRFLLPDPNLGRVAYLGQPSGLLAESLRLFSASLTFPTVNQDQTSATYDVVVACQPSRQMLQMAANLVRPGGFLYLEVAGWSNRLRQGLPNYSVEVARLGFTGVRLHWHWPNFAACTRIIPLSDESALRYILCAGRRDRIARVIGHVSGWLLRQGLLAWSVPHLSVVAQRGDQ